MGSKQGGKQGSVGPLAYARLGKWPAKQFALLLGL